MATPDCIEPRWPVREVRAGSGVPAAPAGVGERGHAPGLEAARRANGRQRFAGLARMMTSPEPTLPGFISRVARVRLPVLPLTDSEKRGATWIA